MQTYERDPNRLSGDFAVTVTAIVKITCKSISSLRRVFAFLMLLGRDKRGPADGSNRDDYRGCKIDVEKLDIRFPASMGTPNEAEVETPKNS